MKIGILIRDYDELKNWELRIIQEIINNPKFELLLLIRDGRKTNSKAETFISKMYHFCKKKNIIGRIVFSLQLLIEHTFFFKEKLTVDKEFIINTLNRIDTIIATPKKEGALDVFDPHDAEKIKKYQLDILLRHEFNIIKGEILHAAKYGIWSFHHADNSINCGGPVGFWEIIYQQPYIGVTLQQLTDKSELGCIIDKAFFNRQTSFVRTNHLILEASVSLLLKNFKKLEEGNYSTKKTIVCCNPLYETPELGYIIKYIYLFYLNNAKSIVKKLSSRLFGTRYNCWSLFIGTGNFLDSALFKLEPVVLPENVFWADPFIFKYHYDTYIFFENYDYTLQKGKISCGKIENNQLIDIKDVLDFDYHLSYPYVFMENNEIYLMPESNANNRLEIYKCIQFPTQWELYSTAFNGEKVADASFYHDENQQKWLFVNKKADLYSPMDSELYIYKVDSLQLNTLEPHKQNPVIIDSRTARNGGAIFKYNNEKYRPSQANIEGIYGRALNLNKIKKLTIDEYIEETIITVKPNFYKGLNSVHHLHQVDGLFVIDAAFRKLKISHRYWWKK